MQSDIPFCTYKIFTHNRADVFMSEASYNLLFDAISFLKKKFKINIYAYLLIPDHLQLVASIELFELKAEFTDNLKTITKKNAIQVLESQAEYQILEQLEIAKGKKKYRLWEVSADVEALVGMELLEKRILSIHSKPAQAGLVQAPSQYQYSSAKFYDSEQATEIKIQDYRTIFS